MKSKNSLIKITTTAVFIALTCVLTMIVQIPSPTKGYMNLGDCAVLLGGYLLGPIYGTIAGGLGSAFADFFAGYPIYVPGTFIIKSLMALTVSLVPYLPSKKKKIFPRITFIFASLVAEMIMIAGYYLYEAIFIGQGFIAALAGITGNVVQGAVGAIGTYLLVELLSRTNAITTLEANERMKKK